MPLPRASKRDAQQKTVQFRHPPVQRPKRRPHLFLRLSLSLHPLQKLQQLLINLKWHRKRTGHQVSTVPRHPHSRKRRFAVTHYLANWMVRYRKITNTCLLQILAMEQELILKNPKRNGLLSATDVQTINVYLTLIENVLMKFANIQSSQACIRFAHLLMRLNRTCQEY